MSISWSRLHDASETCNERSATIFFARFHCGTSRWSDFKLVAVQDVSINLGVLVRYHPHVETLHIFSALLN